MVKMVKFIRVFKNHNLKDAKKREYFAYPPKGYNLKSSGRVGNVLP